MAQLPEKEPSLVVEIPKQPEVPKQPEILKNAVEVSSNVKGIPKESTKPISKSRKIESANIEIDGIKFTSNEKLTSVDDKIETGSRGTFSPSGTVEIPVVQLDKDRIPLTSKDFARAFRQKYCQNNKEDKNGS